MPAPTRMRSPASKPDSSKPRLRLRWYSGGRRVKRVRGCIAVLLRWLAGAWPTCHKLPDALAGPVRRLFNLDVRQGQDVLIPERGQDPVTLGIPFGIMPIAGPWFDHEVCTTGSPTGDHHIEPPIRHGSFLVHPRRVVRYGERVEQIDRDGDQALVLTGH